MKRWTSECNARRTGLLLLMAWTWCAGCAGSGPPAPSLTTPSPTQAPPSSSTPTVTPTETPLITNQGLALYGGGDDPDDANPGEFGRRTVASTGCAPVNHGPQAESARPDCVREWAGEVRLAGALPVIGTHRQSRSGRSFGLTAAAQPDLC
jgi:hypothetical protein